MILDEEEKKKRLQEAQDIISNNYNTSNNEYSSRLTEANNIINSINPPKVTPTYENNNSSTNSSLDDELSTEERIAQKMEAVWNKEEGIQEEPSQQETEEKKFFQAGEFEDGYQFGDITKTALGTATDTIQNIGKGILSVGENILDVGTNLVATIQDILGFDEAAKGSRDFANKDLSQNISGTIANATPIGMLYNLVNGTPEKIFNPAEIEYDTNKNLFENYTSGLQKAWLTESTENYENSSISGEMTDQVVELVGYTLGLATGGQALSGATGTKAIGSAKLGMNLNGGQIGIRLAGKTLNLPTLAMIGGMAGGLQEANSKGENVTELERWGKGISSGIIESFTEGIFGFLGIGGNELTDELGKKVAKQFSSKAAKILVNLGFHASGEAVEEFLSYAGNFLVDNGIIDKLGSTDFSSEWDWGEVFEQMLLAFLSTGLTGGSAMIVDTNSAVKSAEEQLGRNLTQEEKQLVTKAVVDESLQEKIQEMYNQEDIPQEFYVSTFSNDGEIANIQKVRGKQIDNPNKKVNVTPAIVKSGNNVYTVIDSKTGLRLDTTPYDSLLAAESGFNSKMINLKERDINAINTKIGMSNIAVTDTLMNTAQIIQNDITQKRNAIQTSQNTPTDILNTETSNLSSKDNNAVKTQNKTSEAISNINTDIIEKNPEIKQQIQNMATNFLDDLSNSTIGQRYKIGDTWTGQKRSTTKELAEIKDNTNATWKQISQSLEEISDGKITSALSQKIVGYIDTALTDGYKNIYGQNVFPNEEYMNNKKKLGLYQESIQSNNDKIIADEDARVFGEKKRNIQKNNTNFQDEEIRNIVKYNPDGREIKDQNYLDFLVERYKDNKNISRVITDTKYVESIKNKTEKEILDSLYDSIKEKSLKIEKNLLNEQQKEEKVLIDLEITKQGLKESLNKSISDEKLSVIPFLDTLIKTSQDGIIRDENKNRRNILNWYYLYNTAEINGQLYGVKIDLKKTQVGDRFYVHRVNLIKNEGDISTVPGFEHATERKNVSPSVNNSIPQKENSVKENTIVNNKSMQNKRNNTQNNNIRTEKITNTTEYDSQGNKLTKAQQEFFKDSKVRDEKGNLLVMYHGTEANVGLAGDYWFTVFDIDRTGSHGSMLGDGFYFTSDKSHAEQYAHTKGHIYETYLNIRNPLELNHFSTGELAYAIRNINPYIEADIYKRNGTIDGYKVRRYLLDNGYDGIHSGNTFVAFYANQIKNVTNQKPTSNQDIRYEKIKSKTSNNKTLIAQHNTSEEKLLEALDLGALPVPSIAITKYQNPVLKYGDITLLFNKDTINPTDKRNVTYNSDIYSARKPEIGIALDKQKVKDFEKIATERGIGYGYLNMIEEYVEQNEFSRARELIQHELEKTNNNVNMQDIEDIYTKLLESVQEKRIMKSGVDPYTPSGNKKSLIQMSIPYTLDNIVRTMTQKSTKGSESNSFAGLAEIRANLAQNFKSIEAMHQNENNLITSEEMENLKQELNDKFYALVDEIAKYDKVNRYFGSTEVVANALNETAKAKNLSTAILDNELDYVDIKNVPEKTLQKSIDFLNSLKNIPTEYFEAKPQRAVGFNEVQKAIVPENTSKEVIDRLKSKGISISVGENFYNGLALNILKGNTSEVKNVVEKEIGTLSRYVPQLHFNKIDELEKIHKNHDIMPIFKCGYPVVSLIGVEEALTPNKNTISKILVDNYDYIFNIEMQYIQNEDLCNRGKYICIVGVKI